MAAEGFLRWIGWVSLWMLVVLIAATFIERGEILWTLIGAGVAFSSLMIGFKYFVYPYQRFGTDDSMALFLERQLGEPHNRLILAVQLSEQARISQDAITRGLASAAIAQGETTARKLIRIQAIPLSGLMRGLSAALTKLTLVLTCFAMIYWLAPQFMKQVWHTLTQPSQAHAQEEKLAFMVGDIDLTYLYPAYSGLGRRHVPGTGGEIHALKGTRVTVRIRTVSPFSKAEVGFERGSRFPMRKVSSTSFEIDFPLMRADRYAFYLDGSQDAVWRRIQLQEDRPPEISLLHPENDIEVRETDDVELHFKAEDDFGLSKLTLVFDYDAGTATRKSESIELKQFQDTKQFQGSYTWSLARLRLTPGDRVVYRVEATDTDTISGPKTAHSGVRTLRVVSADLFHEELLKKQEKIWEEMIVFLADSLEQPIDKDSALPWGKFATRIQTTENRVESLAAELANLLDEMETDTLTADYVMDMIETMRDSYRTLHSRYDQIPIYRDILRVIAENEEERQRLVEESYAAANALSPRTDNGAEVFEHIRQQHQNESTYIRRMMGFNVGGNAIHQAGLIEGDTVEALEKDIVRLMELINKQRYDALVALAEQIRDEQRDLTDLLERYQRTQDEELRKELLERMAALNKRIQELRERLAKLLQEIPEDFVNLEALQQQQLATDMSDIEEMLRNGDIEEAMRRMQEMARGLEEMLAKMQEASENLGKSLYSEAMRKLQDSLSELRQLEKQQEEITGKAARMNEQYRRKIERDFRNRLKQRLMELRDRVARVRNDLSRLARPPSDPVTQYMDRAMGQLDRLEKALEAEDVAEGREAAHQSESLLKISEEFWRNRERISPSNDPNSNYRTLNRSKERIEEVARELDSMMPNPNRLLSEREKRLMERAGRDQQAIEKSAGGLQQKLDQLGQEVPFLPPRTGEQIRQARNDMRSAENAMRGHNPGQSMQKSRDALQRIQSLREAMEQGMQGMRQGMGYPGRRQMSSRPGRRGHQGMLGDSEERVEIPDAGQYKVPRELREDILEAMKGRSPKRYEQQNRSYYEDLVK